MQVCNEMIFQEFVYAPSPAQKLVHDSNARFRVVAAGSRFGKSMLAGAEMCRFFLLPKRRIWCVSTQYDLAQKEFDWAVQFLNSAKIGERKILSLCKTSISAKGSKTIYSPWDSFIYTKSCEKPQLLLGDELDLLVLCEASQIPKSIWERQLRARLGPRRGFLLATSTPNGDGDLFNWMFDQGKNKIKDWVNFQFSTGDNPYFSRKELNLLKSELAPKVFQEQVEGKFVSRRGLVFGFRNENITKQLPEEHLPRLVGIHYKSHNPISIVFMCVLPDPRTFLVYDEIFLEERTVPDVIPLIIEKIKGKRCLGVFCDYWDSAVQKELKNSGLLIGLNQKEKEIGRNLGLIRRIQAVQNALSLRGDFKPRLLVNENCAHTIEHFKKCKWPEPREAQQELLERELPLTKYLSLPLAISYIVSFLDVAAGVEVYHG